MRGRVLDKDERFGYGVVAPAVVLMAILIVYPIVDVLVRSFRDPDTNGFAGFGNYVDILNASGFGQTIWNTLVWTIGTVLLSFVIGFGAALLIHQQFVRLKNVWITLLMLSWIMPGVVKATAWKWMYSYDFGIWNEILQRLGIVNEPVGWLMNAGLALLAVMIVQVWSSFPFVMLMIYAGLQTVPKELLEAAELDGATGSRKLFRVVLPLLKDVAFIAMLIVITWSINEFATIWIITQGGPAGSTQVLSLSIYEHFQSFELSAAAATAVLQLIVSLVFAVWYVRKTAKEG